MSLDVDAPLALDDDALDSDAAAGPYQPGTPTDLCVTPCLSQLCMNSYIEQHWIFSSQ